MAVAMTACLLASPSRADALSVLAFSRPTGYRHAPIDTAQAVLESLARRHRCRVVRSEDPAMFDAATLATFDVVLFLNTTGDVLDSAQQSTLQAFVEAGGGWAGVHAAADTESDWPFYGAGLLGNGAWFASHPAIQTAQVLRESATHPAAIAFGPSFGFTDEWYNFRASPRAGATVLLRLDEASYSPGAGAMGSDHPIAWTRSVGNGRAFYTGLGHRSETFQEPGFQRHLVAGLYWAAGQEYAPVHADGFE